MATMEEVAHTRASTGAVFLTPGDVELTEKLLTKALSQEELGMSGTDMQAMRALMGSVLALLGKMAQGTEENPHSSASHEQQPVAQPEASTSAPSLVGDVVDLQKQVQEAAERVSLLRQQVPLTILACMQTQLQSLRPSDCSDDTAAAAPSRIQGPEATGGQMEEGEQQDQLKQLPQQEGQQLQDTAATSPVSGVVQRSPLKGPTSVLKQQRQEQEMFDVSVHELRSMLLDLVNKMPSMQARLEQTVQRLTRVVEAVEAEQRSASPRTVEKVLLNRGTGGTPLRGAGDENSLLGAELTRRHLAYELQGAGVAGVYVGGSGTAS